MTNAQEADASEATSEERPTHPGVYVERNIVQRYGLTQAELAKRLHVSRQTIWRIIKGKQPVTRDMAARLVRLTDTSPEFWLQLQLAVDAWDIKHNPDHRTTEVKPLAVPRRS